MAMDTQKNLKISILGKSYSIATDENSDDVHQAARLVDDLMKRNVQIVVLGTGNESYEKELEKFNKKYPKKFSAILKYDGSLARQIFAAVDMFLIPSKFEPCGLTQMIAMKYGTIPIVRATGGLKDTVIHNQTGFVFEKYGKTSMMKAIREALSAYKDKHTWYRMIRNAMKMNFSWDESAKEYLKLYQKAIKFKHDSFI